MLQRIKFFIFKQILTIINFFDKIKLCKVRYSFIVITMKGFMMNIHKTLSIIGGLIVALAFIEGQLQAMEMQMYTFRGPTGNFIIELERTRGNTVLNLKQKIEHDKGIPVAEQRIILNSRILQDNELLAALQDEISGVGTIHFVRQAPVPVIEIGSQVTQQDLRKVRKLPSYRPEQSVIVEVGGGDISGQTGEGTRIKVWGKVTSISHPIPDAPEIEFVNVNIGPRSLLRGRWIKGEKSFSPEDIIGAL